MPTRCLNKVVLIGNLTRDPELRYTPSGMAVVSFGLATNRVWVTKQGEKKEDAQFHRIVAWSKLAEICGQLLFKGRKVFIEGRLQTRKFTGQDGMQREITEIVAENMMVLDTRTREGGAPMGHNGGQEEDFVGVEQAPAAAAATDEVVVEEAKEEKPKKESKKKAEAEEVKAEESIEETVNVDDIPF